MIKETIKKNMALIIAISIAATLTFSSTNVYAKDGTYIPGHFQSRINLPGCLDIATNTSGWNEETSHSVYWIEGYFDNGTDTPAVYSHNGTDTPENIFNGTDSPGYFDNATDTSGYWDRLGYWNDGTRSLRYWYNGTDPDSYWKSVTDTTIHPGNGTDTPGYWIVENGTMKYVDNGTDTAGYLDTVDNIPGYWNIQNDIAANWSNGTDTAGYWNNGDDKPYKIKDANCSYLDIKVENNIKKIDKSVFIGIKGKDKDISITQKNGAQWVFNGNDIKDENNTQDIDLSVSTEDTQNSGVKEKISKITKDGQLIQFGYHGVLPGRAKVKVNVGKDNALKGKSLTLYYYNSDTDKAEKVQDGVTIDADGNVTIEVEHCSDYFLSADSGLDLIADMVFIGVPTDTRDYSENCLIVFGMMLLAGGALVLNKKPSMKKN